MMHRLVSLTLKHRCKQYDKTLKYLHFLTICIVTLCVFDDGFGPFAFVILSLYAKHRYICQINAEK